MKVAVVGGVTSTEAVVEKLAEHGFNDVAVWGYSPQNSANVSGWVNLEKVASCFGFGFSAFTKVDDCEIAIREYLPDIIFVVGLSQIVPPSILEIPKLGAIGFHPTALPKGRGRAPIAWLILNETQGAATFFRLRKGVDDGPILAQEFFDVTDLDDAHSLEYKIIKAEKSALETVIAGIKSGVIAECEQDHSKATWYGRRTPEDGWIDWGMSSEKIAKLVRATASPHPGAYSFIGDFRVHIWSAHVIDKPIIGIVGRIVHINTTGSFVIQCGQGLLQVSNWTCDGDWNPKVGDRLGYYLELEVQRLRVYCTELETRLSRVESFRAGC